MLWHGAISWLDAKIEWDPIDPADLAATKSSIEPDADAEIISRKVKIVDDSDDYSTTWEETIRLKIFTAAGVQHFGQLKLPANTNTEWIKEIEARVINPDGTITNLDHDTVLNQNLKKTATENREVRIIAVPDVKAGAIIDYHWVYYHDYLLTVKRLAFQSDVPVRHVDFFVSPVLGVRGFGALPTREILFNIPSDSLTKLPANAVSVTLNNLKSFRPEPFMPPSSEVEQWMLVYYPVLNIQTPDRYWQEYAREQYEKDSPLLKSNDVVQKKVKAVVGDAQDPEEKARRLYYYCQREIKNLSDDAVSTPGVDRSSLHHLKPSEVVEKGMAYGHDIDGLYIALCRAAGLDARRIHLPDREFIEYRGNFDDAVFLPSASVVVRIGDTWHFGDPANRYLPFGRLRWQEEQGAGIINDPDKVIWVKTPFTPAAETLTRRKADFGLKPDGSLEGDVRIEYSGHFGEQKREDIDALSDAEREEMCRKEIQKYLPQAEINRVRFENLRECERPLVLTFHMRVTGYAETAGSRLILQPAVMEYGVPPALTGSTRTYDFYFPWQWSEDDAITIALPAGFHPENLTSPRGVNAGVLNYENHFSYNEKANTLEVRRTFVSKLSRGSKAGFAGLKKVFDLIHASDDQSVVLQAEKSAN